MAAREVLALNETTPQIEAAQTGDTYLFARNVEFSDAVQMISNEADAADAIGFDYDTANSLSTSGAKIVSWKNATSEAAYIDKDGFIYGGGTIFPDSAQPNAYFEHSGNNTTVSGRTLRLRGQLNTVAIIDASSGAWMDFVTNTDIMQWNRGIAGPVKFQYDLPISDIATNSFTIQGQNADIDASTNLVGGDLILVAGEGSSGSAGAANGGDLILRGGQEYGTGTVGNIIMDTLPTADPTVAGALWSNSGVLTVSAG